VRSKAGARPPAPSPKPPAIETDHHLLEAAGAGREGGAGQVGRHRAGLELQPLAVAGHLGNAGQRQGEGGDRGIVEADLKGGVAAAGHRDLPHVEDAAAVEEAAAALTLQKGVEGEVPRHPIEQGGGVVDLHRP